MAPPERVTPSRSTPTHAPSPTPHPPTDLPVSSDTVRQATLAPRTLRPAQVLQLQRTFGNRAVARLLDGTPHSGTLQGQGKVVLQRQVDKGLKTGTIVINPDKKKCKVLSQTTTGYKLVILGEKPEVKEYTFEELNLPEEIKQLPKDHLGKIYTNKEISPQKRMMLATQEIDILFLKATEAHPTLIPGVASYSWVALGSYGRQEMCPFSDIELGLVYTPNHSNVDALEIKHAFANLGEQVLQTLQKLAAFITLDSEGNYPSGKGGGGLMGEATTLPASIAVASVSESCEARHTMLLDARYLKAAGIGCDPEAFKLFKQSLAKTTSKALKTQEKQSDLNARHLALLALNTLQAGILDVEKKPRFVNVKKNFRQPLNWALMALCVKHHLFEPSGFMERVEALLKQGVLEEEIAKAIVGLYELIFTARIDLHLFHGEELDVLEANPEKKEETGGFEKQQVEKISKFKNHEKVVGDMVNLYIKVAEALLSLLKKLTEEKL